MLPPAECKSVSLFFSALAKVDSFEESLGEGASGGQRVPTGANGGHRGPTGLQVSTCAYTCQKAPPRDRIDRLDRGFQTGLDRWTGGEGVAWPQGANTLAGKRRKTVLPPRVLEVESTRRKMSSDEDDFGGEMQSMVAQAAAKAALSDLTTEVYAFEKTSWPELYFAATPEMVTHNHARCDS